MGGVAREWMRGEGDGCMQQGVARCVRQCVSDSARGMDLCNGGVARSMRWCEEDGCVSEMGKRLGHAGPCIQGGRWDGGVVLMDVRCNLASDTDP